MATGLNKITIIGNLGKDPEVRYTQSGNAVCNLRVAVTEKRKEGDEWRDHTEWFTAICFGKTAENAGKFLKKGRQIYADGRLQSRNYQDKEGQTKTSVEIVVNQLLFLGGGREGGSGDGDFVPMSESRPAPARTESEFIDEDDVPF